MNHFRPEVRAQMVIIFVECGRCPTTAIRRIRREFNGEAPDRNMLKRWLETLCNTGSLCETKRKRANPVRNDINRELVLMDICENPTESTRNRSIRLGIGRRSLQRILTKDLKAHAYKTRTVQELLPSDPPKRLEYCTRILEMERIIPNFKHRILFTDEAHFEINGSVNRQNHINWALSNPYAMFEKGLHSARVTVWCGMLDDKVSLIIR